MTLRTLFVVEDAAPGLADGLPATAAHWFEEERRLLLYADAGADALAALLPQATRHALSPLLAIEGPSAGEPAPNHYIVWTDAAPGWDDELNDWYAQEHLPGLAAVPGAVRARRYRQDGPGPLWFACYDLTAPEVLGSPPWLKVRATDWSSRVRPNFTNTRRWMTRTLYNRSAS